MEETEASTRLRLAELLSALSVVTDLGIGRPREAAMRSCLLATELACRMQIPAMDRADIYYTTLLRYIGCTAYAEQEAALWGGDSWDARNIATRIDWRNRREVRSFSRFVAAQERSRLRRVYAGAITFPRTLLSLKELVAAHCEVGSIMAQRLGMRPAVQEALTQIFERWDGKGGPQKLAGDALSLPVRFAQVATQAVANAQIGGVETACEVIRGRAGSSLDPAICEAFLSYGAPLLSEMDDMDIWKAVIAIEPEPRYLVPELKLDDLAHAFADMVDLQTPFTRGYSTRVAELAEGAGCALGLGDLDIVRLRRAALFHDLGRVGISNNIWQKSGPLSDGDWERVRLHPYHTERILIRCPALAPISRLAGMHHERQDGSGYYREIAGSQIPFAARLLAAADVYAALTQQRPHRPALDPREAARQLNAEASARRLDHEAVRGVLSAAGQQQLRGRTAYPAGLSEREVEVLRLIARGASYKEVARELVISPRTAAHHVQHIYNKIGVSTRAAAAMFAMEHDLLLH